MSLLTPGRVDHGYDASPERLGQGWPGAEDSLKTNFEHCVVRGFAQAGRKRRITC